MSVLIPLANGFEEIEAICVIDILRRAGLEVVSAGLSEGYIEASRKTRHLPDISLDKVLGQEFDLIVLPGGQPGTDNLKEDHRIRNCLLAHAKQGKWIGAICAAPLVLHHLRLLDGKKITSHPSVKEQLSGTHYLEDRVVVDGNLVTSRGPGTALEFSFKLVELLCGKAKVSELNKGVLACLDTRYWILDSGF